MEDGAVGYTKTEVYDDDEFYWNCQPVKFNTSAITHNHTYGAPPGGVPHVRKMDMKVSSLMLVISASCIEGLII